MAAYAGFMTDVTCRLSAKNRDQLRNPIRSAIQYGLPFTLLSYDVNRDVFVLFKYAEAEVEVILFDTSVSVALRHV